MSRPLAIGVLALQGDFAAHAGAFERRGCSVSEIREPEAVASVDGLVLPGGETTTLIKLLRETGLWDAVRRAPAQQRPILGTCAGLILLAEKVTDPVQESMDLLSVSVRRNGYGRQVDSFVAAGEVRIPPELAAPHQPPMTPAEFVFIRAPVISEVGGGVEVLARHDGVPVLVRQGWVLAGSFHPELSADGTVERLFLALVARARAARQGGDGGP